jgi:tetratricopeptide (TPR) repeat protein
MRLLPLILLVFSFPLVEARSQDIKEGILLAPRSNLAAVHWPDLSTVEVEVREHLLKEQASLTAAVKAARTNDATLSEAYGSMGQTFHAYSFNAPARECYVNASRLATQDFRWFHLMARLDQQDGRIFESIKNYLIAQSLNPNYVASSINLGNIFLEANRLSEARQHFAAALKIDKDSPSAHYGLGQVALSERNYAEAVKYFERTLAIVSAANRIHYSLAMAYRGLGEVEKARVHLRLQGTVGVRVTDPLFDQLQELVQGERLHLIRGRLALDAKRYTEASYQFRKAIASRPESVTGRVNLGATLNLMGDVPGAIEQFEAVLGIAPENANAHYNLGVLLARQNKFQDAATHLQLVVKSNPSDASARSFLAQIYLGLAQHDKALEEFTQIVEMNPSDEQALLAQAQLLVQKKQYKQALDSLEKGHAAFPDKTGTTILLARLLATSPSLELRNGSRALELANRVYKATGSLEHGAVISMALAELGRCTDALEWQKKLLESAQRSEQISTAENLKRDLQLYERSPCRPPSQ